MQNKDRALLTILIRKSIEAHNASYTAQKDLNDFCERHWGFAPSDRDVDEIIDDVLGGCGLSSGMHLDTFIKLMDNAAKDD